MIPAMKVMFRGAKSILGGGGSPPMRLVIKSWNAGPVIAHYQNVMARRSRAAGEHLAARVRHNISRPGSPGSPSAPGQYPHLVSGELHGSVFTEPSSTGVEILVGARAKHAPHVEKLRPFISRTLQEEWDTVRRIMTGR